MTETSQRDARTLYQDVIVAHGKSPHNEGALDGATHEATVKNPLCGDRVTLRLRVVDGTIAEARFEAKGCMIARASSSLLTDAVHGVSLCAALALMPASNDRSPPETRTRTSARSSRFVARTRFLRGERVFCCPGVRCRARRKKRTKRGLDEAAG